MIALILIIAQHFDCFYSERRAVVRQNLQPHVIRDPHRHRLGDDDVDLRLGTRAMRQRVADPAAADARAVGQRVTRRAEFDELGERFLDILGIDQERDATRAEGPLPPCRVCVTRELDMAFEADDLQREPFGFEVFFEVPQFLHRAVIDELRIGKVDDHVAALDAAELIDFALERNPVAEHGRLRRADNRRVFVGVLDLEIRLEERIERHTVVGMNQEFYRHTDADAGATNLSRVRQ